MRNLLQVTVRRKTRAYGLFINFFFVTNEIYLVHGSL